MIFFFIHTAETKAKTKTDDQKAARKPKPKPTQKNRNQPSIRKFLITKDKKNRQMEAKGGSRYLHSTLVVKPKHKQDIICIQNGM